MLNAMLSRRDFLRLNVLLGGAVMITPSLSACTTGNDYETQIGKTWETLGQDKEPEMKEIIRYATLAANSHNSQPWKFAVREDLIEIHPDYTRRLPVVDPDDRS
ncbi:MAG: hypothetical protein Q7U53_02530 [Anaerolineaceae bacterium]|nr:hypothetical protein [Anaerolineaceae bacterium]